MKLISVAPDVELSVLDWGTGKTVVFIPGWCYGHEMYEYQLTALSQNYRCVAISMRGFGDSDKPFDGYSFDTFADDVKKVLETLETEDATLVGFSMGGAIALNYAARHNAAHLSKLVLLGAATPLLTKRADFPNGADPANFDGLIAGCQNDRAALNEGFAKQTFHQEHSPAFYREIERQGMKASPLATAKCVELLRDQDQRELMAQIKVPTLVCHGRHDQVAPIEITGRVLHENIKDSQFIVFEESGHGLFYDEKDKLNQVLADFIN